MTRPVMVDLIARDRFSATFAKMASESEASARKLEGHGKRAAAAARTGMLLVGAAAAGILVASARAASAHDDAQARLRAAVEASGGSFKTLEAPLAAASKKMEDLGFNNTQTADALGTLTVASKNPIKAIGELGIVADLARFKHIGLGDAAAIVGKAMAGNLKPIKALGIDLPIAAGGALKLANANTGLSKAQDTYNAALKTYNSAPTAANHAKLEAATIKLHDAQKKVNDVAGASNLIFQALSERLKGQASSAAGTLAGKSEVLRAKLHDIGIKIGETVIPAIDKLITWIIKGVKWFDSIGISGSTLAKILGGVVVTAMLLMIKTWLGVNAAFLFTPIGALIAGLVALGVAVYLAWQNWDKIWGWFKTTPVYKAVVVAFGVIKRGLDLLLQAVSTAWQLWTTIWGFIVGALRGAALLIVGALHGLVNIVLGFVGTIIDGLASAFGGLPLIGGPIKAAAREFDKFRRNVDGNFKAMEDTIRGHPLRPIVDIYPAMLSLQALNNSIAAATHATYQFSTAGDYVPHHAAGGVLNAGWSMVGEQGPELLFNSGAGGRVYSNSESKRMLSDTGGQSLPPIYIQNPFTGEYLLAQVDDRTQMALASQARETRLAGGR